MGISTCIHYIDILCIVYIIYLRVSTRTFDECVRAFFFLEKSQANDILLLCTYLYASWLLHRSIMWVYRRLAHCVLWLRFYFRLESRAPVKDINMLLVFISGFFFFLFFLIISFIMSDNFWLQLICSIERHNIIDIFRLHQLYSELHLLSTDLSFNAHINLWKKNLRFFRVH